MKIVIATLGAAAALSLAACHPKPAEETTNTVVENSADLNAAGESLDNSETSGNALLSNDTAGPDAGNASTNGN